MKFFGIYASIVIVLLAVGFGIGWATHGALRPAGPAPVETPPPLASAVVTPSPQTPQPQTDETTITISAMGDCTLGTDDQLPASVNFDAVYTQNGQAFFFDKVRPILEKDDFSIVNLEGTFTTATEKFAKGQPDEEGNLPLSYHFKGLPAYAAILTNGSIEAVNFANNHNYDYKQQGIDDTKAALEKENIAYFYNTNGAILEKNGVKIGFAGFETYADTKDLREKMVKVVEQLKTDGAQLVVVNYHWGDEGSYTPADYQMSLARYTIDAGVDLVIGHHPHVLQPIEEYKGKLIAYSLGNFCFGGNTNPKDRDTAILQQTFRFKDGVLEDSSYQLIPCLLSSDSAVNNYQPIPVQGADYQRIMRKLGQ